MALHCRPKIAKHDEYDKNLAILFITRHMSDPGFAAQNMVSVMIFGKKYRQVPAVIKSNLTFFNLGLGSHSKTKFFI